MAEPGGVIELGSDFALIEWERPPPPVWWRRGWALIGYAAIVLLLLGPGAPVGLGPVVPVGAIPAGGAIAYELSADTLFAAWFAFRAPTFGAAETRASQATLDAYRLSDGQLRWRVLIPVDLGSLLIRTAGPDTVVVSSLDLGATGDRTVAYDAYSGRLLWDSRLPLLPAVEPAATVVLGAYLDGDGEPAGSPYVQTPGTGTVPAMLLQAVGVRTGAVAWSLRVPRGYATALPVVPAYPGRSGAAYAVLIGPGGEARSVDLHRGTVTGTGRVRSGPTLLVSGHWLLSGYPDRGVNTLASYRADTLAPAWTGTVRSLDLAVTECGELTCLTDPEGTRAVDLAAGETRWTAPAWQPVAMLDGWVYAMPQQGRGGPDSLLSPASGAPVLDLAGWSLIPGMAGSQYLVSAGRPADQLGSAPTAAWLGVLRASAAGLPRVVPVAPLSGSRVGGCTAAQPFVLCDAGDQRLWIWRLRA
ncbi:MAG TPA: hypothetical protein VJT31_13370 [Rugosimonospora sp.]|nr:hypothetical protein [Rugosimonospora sp.]